MASCRSACIQDISGWYVDSRGTDLRREPARCRTHPWPRAAWLHRPWQFGVRAPRRHGTYRGGTAATRRARCEQGRCDPGNQRYPAALAAKKGTTLPVVVYSAGDPVATGLVESLARPGGNLTGISDLTVELSPKRLELLKEITPNLHRVAMLWNAGDPA